MFDARQLAGYIISCYKEDYSNDISSIKLQKALYFLFAFWGGFVRKSKDADPDSIEEVIDEEEILFNNRIEAWVYGPVVPDVYTEFKYGLIEQNYCGTAELFKDTNSIVKDTIDSMLNDIFPIADFKLVSISHEDKCWINNFDVSEKKHNKEIPAEEIIREYATRALI